MKAIGCLLISQLLLWAGTLSGQDQIDTKLKEQRGQIAEIFTYVHGNMTHLIGGRQHIEWYPSIDGDPYWFPNAWIPGELKTHQYHYKDLPMKYDAYLDALVFLPDSFSIRRIWVNPELVSYFTLVNNTFIYLGLGEEKEALTEANLKPGYFELLYDGDSRLLYKRTKYIKTTQSSTQVLGTFTKKSFFYLYTRGKFFNVKSKRKFLRALGERADKVNAYLKEHNYKYKTLSNSAFGEILNYYDSL